MTSAYRREHIKSAGTDEFDVLSAYAKGRINNLLALLEGWYEDVAFDARGNARVSEGERLAFRRAAARFLIDSGMASANGDI